MSTKIFEKNFYNQDLESMNNQMKMHRQKLESECCQNCEYAISDELLDCIIEENSEYQNLSYEEVREQIGYCELYITSDIPDKLGSWCPNYFAKEKEEIAPPLKKIRQKSCDH